MPQHHPYTKLYIKKNTGKIQEWDIYVEEKSAKDVWLSMDYGEIEGKKVHKTKQITSTKSKRSLVEEALKQAETKYNEKVNKEGYTTHMPTQMTRVVRPMLANKYDMGKGNMKFPCIGEPKCDGNRGIIYIKGNEIVIESRNGTLIYYFDHIREEVAKLLAHAPDGLYLDGELFTHDLTFNMINGMCNRKPSKKGNESDKQTDKKVKYYVFDCFDLNNLDMKMIERKQLLRKLFSSGEFKYLELIEGEILKSKDDVKKKHDEYVKNGGYEGIMLRDINGKYELKKRSKFLLKYKEFMDEEFNIIGFDRDVDGGVIWECETNILPKSTFTCRPRGSLNFRTHLFKNAEKFIGNKLTVIFQEFTDEIHGIPRFPVGKDIRNLKDLD